MLLLLKEEVTENLERASKGHLCLGVPVLRGGTEAPSQEKKQQWPKGHSGHGGMWCLSKQIGFPS